MGHKEDGFNYSREIDRNEKAEWKLWVGSRRYMIILRFE
jgi:hypothetical protein